MSRRKSVPKFKNLEDEAQFWNEHDSTEYIDWSKANQVTFPNLKRSTTSISLRLPTWLLERIKQLANEKDMPYQSLMKSYLCDRAEGDFEKSQQRASESSFTAYGGLPTPTNNTDGNLGHEADRVLSMRAHATSDDNNKENSGW